MAKNYKQGRINADVKRVLSEIIGNLKDPRLPYMPTVVAAEVSADQKYCKIYISFFGDYDEKEVNNFLKNAKGFIRKQMADKLSLRQVPELTFIFDNSAEKGARINTILKEIISDE